MGKWRGGIEDDESYEKIVKMRKGKKKSSKNSNLQETFEKHRINGLVKSMMEPLPLE